MMESGLGLVDRIGWFRWRCWWSSRMLQWLILDSYVVGWGRGWMQGGLCWVFSGRDWDWGRQFCVGVVFFLVWLRSLYQVGGLDPTFMSEVEVGLTNGWRTPSGVNLEWWEGFVMAEVRRFEFTMVLPGIWYSDRVAIVWKPLVIDRFPVWIDVEKRFEARKGGLGEIGVRVCWWLRSIGSSEFSRSDRVQMLGVAESGTYWFVHGDGMVIVLAKNLSSVPDLSALESCVFLLLFYVGSIFRSQISPCFFESGLSSRILVGVWLWVIGSMFIGPCLLPAFSRAIDSQPVLRTLTLLSMSNAREGYPKGRPNQLCYLLVNLTQSTAHTYCRFDPLTSQLLLYRVRIFSLKFLACYSISMVVFPSLG